MNAWRRKPILWCSVRRRCTVVQRRSGRNQGSLVPEKSRVTVDAVKANRKNKWGQTEKDNMDTEQYTMLPEEEHMEVLGGRSVSGATRVERVCEKKQGRSRIGGEKQRGQGLDGEFFVGSLLKQHEGVGVDTQVPKGYGWSMPGSSGRSRARAGM